MCDKAYDSELNELKLKFYTSKNAEIVKLYVRITSIVDNISRIYKISFVYASVDDFVKFSDEENVVSVSIEDIETISLLDTTAYRIRLMTDLTTYHLYGCSSDMGCEVEHNYIDLNDYIFAGPKYRPVISWNEIHFSKCIDPLACKAVKMNGEVECDDFSDDDDNCQLKYDEAGDIIWKNRDVCPEVIMGIECQKASFDGIHWDISNVSCQ